MGKSVRRIALRDISEWMREQKIEIQDEHGDVWAVTANRVGTPEQSKLNKELGVSKVNYTKSRK